MKNLHNDKLLMVIAMEEAGELITELLAFQKRLSKAIRFNLEQVQEGQLKDNSQRIIEEYNDIRAVMRVIESLGIIKDIERPDLQLVKIKELYQQINKSTSTPDELYFQVEV